MSQAPVERRGWGSRRGYGAAAAAVALFVIYGSLVPLAFRPIPFRQALQQFSGALAGPLFIDSRTDFVTNILLTIPLGYLTLAALMTDRTGHARRYAAALLTLSCCFALSLVAEFAQVFSQGRIDSLSDVVAQGAGAVVGVALWLFIGGHATRWVRDSLDEREPTAIIQRILLVYCVLFAISQLLPLDLTINVGQLARKYRHGLILIRPFARTYPSIVEMWWAYFGNMALNIPIGAAAVLLWTRERSRRPPLSASAIGVAAAAMVVFAQVLVYSRPVDATDVITGAIGVMLGVGAATTFTRRQPVTSAPRPLMWRARFAKLGVAAWIVALASYHWNPFDFTAAPDRVALGMHQLLSIPFSSYYVGSQLHAVNEMLRKGLLAVPLGALLRLSWSQESSSLTTSQVKFYAAMAFGFCVLTAIEVGQVFLPTRTPDMTDALIGEIGVVAALWLTDRLTALRRSDQAAASAGIPVLFQGGTTTHGQEPRVESNDRAFNRVPYLPWVALALALIVIGLGIKTVLRLPGIPYNVSGLFLGGGSTAAIAVFAAALLWIGAGPLLLARWLSRSRYPCLVFLAGMVMVAMVSRTLLKYSVTYESLDDILGTNNLFSLVVNGNIWGDFWRHAFLSTNAADLVDYFERRIRYIALYTPLAGCLALAFLPIWNARPGRIRFLSAPSGWLALSAVVSFWVSKRIIFDWAATDNLTELVATTGPLGLSGAPWLFVLIALFAANVALLVRASQNLRRLPAALAFFAAAIPGGWALLHLGLEGQVVKYGQTFSGAQFLLGPDRQHSLSELTLFMRWAAVQAGGVAVVFIGAWIAHRFVVSMTTGALVPGGATARRSTGSDTAARVDVPSSAI
jgi:glycopeptide antibiotics resistance protein